MGVGDLEKEEGQVKVCRIQAWLLSSEVLPLRQP